MWSGSCGGECGMWGVSCVENGGWWGVSCVWSVECRE